MALAAGWKLAQSCCEIIMTYYYGILTSCREAALNYFALLVFGRPQAAGTGAGTGGSGKVLLWLVAWPGHRSSGCRSACADVFGACVTAHRMMFSSCTHPPARYLRANLIFHSGH